MHEDDADFDPLTDSEAAVRLAARRAYDSDTAKRLTLAADLIRRVRKPDLRVQVEYTEDEARVVLTALQLLHDSPVLTGETTRIAYAKVRNAYGCEGKVPEVFAADLEASEPADWTEMVG